MTEKSDPAPGAPALRATAKRSHAVGRPRGPERIARTVRLLKEQDRRLAVEVEQQGLSPQYLIEQALTEYFARLDRRRRTQPQVSPVAEAAVGR